MVLTGRPWKLVLIGGFFILAVGGVYLTLLVREQRRIRVQALAHELLGDARLLRAVVQERWTTLESSSFADVLAASRAQGVQLAIVASDGKVLLASPGHDPASAVLAAPEAQQALLVGEAVDTRGWGPDGRTHVLVAVRVGDDRAPLGVVRLARSVHVLADRPDTLTRLAAWSAAVLGAATLAFVAIVFEMRRRVFRRVLAAAQRLSGGETADVPDLLGDDELAQLAAALHAVQRRMCTQSGMVAGQHRTLQALLDQLQEGVIVARPNGRIALINAAAARLLKLKIAPGTEHTLVGRPLETCVIDHALHRMLVPTVSTVPGIASVAPDASATAGESECPFSVVSPQGLTYLRAQAFDIPLEGSDLPGRAVLLTDTTALQRHLQVRTDFVANASHELRTPLATIRAAVETLLAVDLQTERDAAVQFLDKIDRHSARLQQLVADLLDLSRLETASERFEPEELDPQRVLADLHERFADQLNARGLQWTATLAPPDLVTVWINPHLLRLILDNLVDNAIKFTEPGGEIAVAVRREPAELVLQVRDTGCGIPPEEHERVFERFYQVQRSRSGPDRGTGLGLSIVRHAVNAMHGSVRLESAVGRGTSVVILIPQAARSDGLPSVRAAFSDTQ